MLSSKNIDLLRDFAAVFKRVYRLEIQSVIMLVFSTQVCKLLPLTFSLVQLSTLPPFPV
jgi:hypothetical protein